MPTLYVLSGPDLGRSHDVKDGAVLGRANDCEVVLHASSISRRHARLELDGERWFAVDLDSRNGIFLDDHRAKRFELTDGALFRLGDLELRFRAVSPPVDVSESDTPVAGVPAPAPVESAPAPTAETQFEPEPEIEFDDSIEFDEPAADLVGGVEIELENEEALDAPAPATATPASSSTPDPTRRPAPAPKARPSREAQERRDEAVQRAGARAAMGGTSRGGAEPLQSASRPALRYSQEPERSGFASADLSQYPVWVRAFAGVLALAFFAAVFWFAFKGTESLKGAGSGATIEGDLEPGEDE